jgi:hypothetical protein
MTREELLSIVITCLLAGAARGEAVGASCRESLEGHTDRSCERAIPKFKPVVVAQKPKKPIVFVPPKVVLAPPPKVVIVPTLAKAPELDAGGMVGALTLLGGAILVMRGRKRRLDG